MTRVHHCSCLRTGIHHEPDGRSSSEDGVGPEDVFGCEGVDFGRGRVGWGGEVVRGKRGLGGDGSDEGVDVLDGWIRCDERKMEKGGQLAAADADGEERAERARLTVNLGLDSQQLVIRQPLEALHRHPQLPIRLPIQLIRPHERRPARVARPEQHHVRWDSLILLQQNQISDLQPRRGDGLGGWEGGGWRCVGGEGSVVEDEVASRVGFSISKITEVVVVGFFAHGDE